MPEIYSIFNPNTPKHSITHGNHRERAAPRHALTPAAEALSEILLKTPSSDAEAALSSSGIRPTPEDVQGVLKLLSGSPSSAVQFFGWAGSTRQHTRRSWSMIVELLGKNQMFDQMWDAIRTMKQEGVLSVTAFVAAFGSYCVAGRIDEALMTFDVMERYGVQQSILAVNSLLSAICRETNQTAKAEEFLKRVITDIPPDADSFAILLEGWEKEGNVAQAKVTFDEMVAQVGWSPEYMSAYDAFLTTLVCGNESDEAIKVLKVMKEKKCLPGMKFFSRSIDILVNQNDSAYAFLLWDIMVESGLVPNLVLYNAMIGLLCNNNDVDHAFSFLDDMIYHGAFPDSSTYNMIFACLIKNGNVRGVGNFFTEMVKNEYPPTHSNCAKAIGMLFEGDDPEVAVEIWEYVLENHISPLEDSANALLIGLCNLERPTELRRFADKMLDKGISIYESTMGKLKNSFCKGNPNAREVYEYLSRKWKSY